MTSAIAINWNLCFISQQQKDEEVKYPGRAKGATDESVYRVFNDFMNNF